MNTISLTENGACWRGRGWFQAHFEDEQATVKEVLDECADCHTGAYAAWLFARAAPERRQDYEEWSNTYNNESDEYSNKDYEYWITALTETGHLEDLVTL